MGGGYDDMGGGYDDMGGGYDDMGGGYYDMYYMGGRRLDSEDRHGPSTTGRHLLTDVESMDRFEGCSAELAGGAMYWAHDTMREPTDFYQAEFVGNTAPFAANFGSPPVYIVATHDPKVKEASGCMFSDCGVPVMVTGYDTNDQVASVEQSGFPIVTIGTSSYFIPDGTDIALTSYVDVALRFCKAGEQLLEAGSGLI